MKRFLACAAVSVLLCSSVWAAGEKLLWGFEDENELKQWEFGSGKPQLSDQHVTQGRMSLKLTTNEAMRLWGNKDWSGYESLDMDIFVEGDKPVSMSTLR